MRTHAITLKCLHDVLGRFQVHAGLPHRFVRLAPLGVGDESIDLDNHRVHIVKQRLHAAKILGDVHSMLVTARAVLGGASFHFGELFSNALL